MAATLRVSCLEKDVHVQDTLYRMDFSAEDLKRIPKAHAAFMVSSCLAISDIAVFQRLLLMALNAPNFKGQHIDEVAAEYALTQALVIQRTLSGKLREYLHMCWQYHDGCKQRSDMTLKPFLDRSREVYEELKTMPGYELADWYRNQVTHHYILKNISGLLNHIQSGRPYSIYLHQKDGNCGYFLGERVLVHKLGDLPSKDEIERLNEFQDWVVHAARVVVRHKRLTTSPLKLLNFHGEGFKCVWSFPQIPLIRYPPYVKYL